MGLTEGNFSFINFLPKETFCWPSKIQDKRDLELEDATTRIRKQNKYVDKKLDAPLDISIPLLEMISHRRMSKIILKVSSGSLRRRRIQSGV